MSSNTLDKFKDIIKDIFYQSKIFWFHLFLFFTILPTVTMFSIYLGFSLDLVFSLVVIIIGHFFISSLIAYFHKRAGTKDILKDKVGMFLVQTAGISEIFFYTFLLIFHQTTIVIGYLIVKTMWNYPTKGDILKDSIAQQTKANSIFRIGILLTLIISFIAACIFNSRYDLENKNFQTINKIFIESTRGNCDKKTQHILFSPQSRGRDCDRAKINNIKN